MNWAERHIQQIETPKTKAKEYIEWGLKLLFTATGITVAFSALMYLGFESVETKEQQEIQMWCDEYMPELSIRASYPLLMLGLVCLTARLRTKPIITNRDAVKAQAA